MPTAFDIVTLLIVLTATFGFLNAKLLRLPHSIGLLLMGLAASLVLVAAELVFPDLPVSRELAAIVRGIDFRDAVLEGMLAFLLFAGALHVDLSLLRERAWVVGLMASLGVLLSTAIVGLGFWYAAAWRASSCRWPGPSSSAPSSAPPTPWPCSARSEAVRVPKTLELDMTGESLFNDGVGVVVFTIALTVAAGGHGAAGFSGAAELFALEAVGGGLLGYLAGTIAYRAMRAIDNYRSRSCISLGLVTGTYALAASLGTSGPIAMVVAGLIIGNAARLAMR